MSQTDLAVFALWGFRLGALLMVLGLLLPSPGRRTVLQRVVTSGVRTWVTDSETRKAALMRWLERLTEASVLRHLMLVPGSKDYEKLAERIQRAGDMDGLTPNIVQLFRLLIPPVVFVLLTGWYLIALRVRTATLTEYTLGDRLNSFIQPVLVQGQGAGFSAGTMATIVLLSAAVYLLPDAWIALRIRNREAAIRKELPLIESFVVIMLESGLYTVHEILQTLQDTTHFFRPYLTMCLNEYFVNAPRAIQRMADKVGDPEFQILCNALKQAADTEKEYTAKFLRQHLDQLRQIQFLQREARIKQRPLQYVILLGIPLSAAVVVWFYPWFIRAIRAISFMI